MSYGSREDECVRGTALGASWIKKAVGERRCVALEGVSSFGHVTLSQTPVVGSQRIGYFSEMEGFSGLISTANTVRGESISYYNSPRWATKRTANRVVDQC